VILDLIRQMDTLAAGERCTVPIVDDSQLELVRRWSEATGNTLVPQSVPIPGASTSSLRTATVIRGRLRDPATVLGVDRMPGTRLWIYTNFNCNLACDYCCVGSGPRVDPREIGAERIVPIVRDAAAWGVQELYLTGGEPFLLPYLGAMVVECAEYLPVVILTNGMLFRGAGLKQLRAMPRDRVAMQISIDSPTSLIHDRHRGLGSWQRAIAGIAIARAEGFRVRVAATVGGDDGVDAVELQKFFDGLSIDREDQIIRPVAREGASSEGVLLSTETLIPEVTVTAEGVYWHPVAATDPDALVSSQIEPISEALDMVRALFQEQWHNSASQVSAFTCA